MYLSHRLLRAYICTTSRTWRLKSYIALHILLDVSSVLDSWRRRNDRRHDPGMYSLGLSYKGILSYEKRVHSVNKPEPFTASNEASLRPSMPLSFVVPLSRYHLLTFIVDTRPIVINHLDSPRWFRTAKSHYAKSHYQLIRLFIRYFMLPFSTILSKTSQ